jgi:hypothetical protein
MDPQERLANPVDGLPPILTTAQAATLLDCEPEQVKYLASHGSLPGHKFGRSWVFDTSSLLNHVRRLCERNLRSSDHPSLAQEVRPDVSSEAYRHIPGGVRLSNPPIKRGPGRPRSYVPPQFVR